MRGSGSNGSSWQTPSSLVLQSESRTVCGSGGQKSVYMQDPRGAEPFSGPPAFTAQTSWVSGPIFVLNKERNLQNTDRGYHNHPSEGEVVMFCWCLSVFNHDLCVFFTLENTYMAMNQAVLHTLS